MMTQTQTPTKAYKGMAMEGLIATWYARITSKQDDFMVLAQRLRAQLAPNSRILEVAPGPGYLAIELAKRGFNVVGLDISKSFIEIASTNARHANVAVDFRLGNASQMPFESNAFDFIVCRAAFKNFSDPVGAIREMYRVLRPCGKALIIDLRRDAPPEAIDEEVRRMHMNPINAFMTKLTFQTTLLKSAYTTKEIRDMVAQTDFHRCDIQTDAVGMEIELKK
jgi:ubiquinone/menaquinone biosynthesis C-methylase UbiE